MVLNQNLIFQSIKPQSLKIAQSAWCMGGQGHPGEVTEDILDIGFVRCMLTMETLG